MAGNVHITDAQVEAAAARMLAIVDGAENACQAAEDALIRADAAGAMQEALLHAEAILTYTPLMSTNKGGKGPSTTTEIARSKVRAALAKANGRTEGS